MLVEIGGGEAAGVVLGDGVFAGFGGEFREFFGEGGCGGDWGLVLGFGGWCVNE